MRRALKDQGNVLERIAVRAVEQAHRHTFRYEGPCAIVDDYDVHRCIRCPKIAIKRREAR